ncbi:MAG TPA: helix-turn-helix transcriptional regulator [Ktedonobacteraceae bacterium]|nr:helix-turn-helix transcriptional regulator [Ktedonobacteraceae bacterium]
MLRLRIKELAEERGISQSKLSRMSDVHITTIRRLYNNPYGGVNILTLEKIAQVLGVEISDLTEKVPDEK